MNNRIFVEPIGFNEKQKNVCLDIMDKLDLYGELLGILNSLSDDEMYTKQHAFDSIQRLAYKVEKQIVESMPFMRPDHNHLVY
ncbi:hypothetical protein LSG31_00475 [Fodinisporobacter ferrooxydans]|uniref:Uncharacterized protein n=1 Tax=Fodinisporobacter ferrooxydans TaxID=2901836 RepID=A0ABY4CJU6_9BACL|nr:hypothetical protein LSG31_00475 [Alicyclobacillaceae bacterium MYW30-H2]